MLNSLDYAIFGSCRPLPWGEFLHKNFTEQVIAKAQSRVGRAMIWSPGSSTHMPEASKDDSMSRKPWGELLSFIDIDHFEQPVPPTQVPNNRSNVTLVGAIHPNGATNEKENIGSQFSAGEPTHKDVNLADDDGEEEGIISLGRLGLVEPLTTITEVPPYSFESSAFCETRKVHIFLTYQTRADTIQDFNPATSQ
jgi:hypothetical protein